MKDYKQGGHYETMHQPLSNPMKSSGYSLKAAKKPYGYLITYITPYVCIYKKKLVINGDGTAKCTVKVNRNYQVPYQYTCYFDAEGKEIISYENSTRKELAIYNRIRKGIQP